MISLAAGVPSYAQIFGTIRVSVIDPQNGSVPNAQIIIRAKKLTVGTLAKTNADGTAVIQAVPIGDYIVSVSAEGFTTATDKAIQVTSDKVTPLQVQLAVGGVEQSISVTEALPTAMLTRNHRRPRV